MYAVRIGTLYTAVGSGGTGSVLIRGQNAHCVTDDARQRQMRARNAAVRQNQTAQTRPARENDNNGDRTRHNSPRHCASGIGTHCDKDRNVDGRKPRNWGGGGFVTETSPG